MISVANDGAPPLESKGIDPEEHSNKLRSQTEATTTEDRLATGEALPKPSRTPLSSSSTTLNSSSDCSLDDTSNLTSSPSSSSSPSYSLALVVRTGNSTARGSLLRRTLFPSLFLFKYDSQLPAVFLIMLAYAAVVIGIIFKFSPNATGIAGWFYAMGSLSQLLPVRSTSFLCIYVNIYLRYMCTPAVGYIRMYTYVCIFSTHVHTYIPTYTDKCLDQQALQETSASHPHKFFVQLLVFLPFPSRCFSLYEHICHPDRTLCVQSNATTCRLIARYSKEYAYSSASGRLHSLENG